jgi:hypothetical protein
MIWGRVSALPCIPYFFFSKVTTRVTRRPPNLLYSAIGYWYKMGKRRKGKQAILCVMIGDDLRQGVSPTRFGDAIADPQDGLKDRYTTHSPARTRSPTKYVVILRDGETIHLAFLSLAGSVRFNSLPVRN